MKTDLEKAKKDYGALYFFINLFRIKIEIDDVFYPEIESICLFALGKQWPSYMKFKPIAILALLNLNPIRYSHFIEEWLNEEKTPFWVSRYATLIGIETLLKDHNFKYLSSFVKTSRNDSNKFVRLKSFSVN